MITIEILQAVRPYVVAHANDDDRAREVLRELDAAIKQACPDCGSTGAICPDGNMGCHFD